MKANLTTGIQQEIHCKWGIFMTTPEVMLLVMTCLWTTVYIFSIVYALRNKTHAIPPISLAFNFSWELIAMLFFWEYVAILWVITDIFIVILFINEYRTNHDKKGFLYLIPFVCWSLLCIFLFKIQIPGKFNGFYFLGFAQDLFMAIEFNYEFKKKTKSRKIDFTLWLVALFKLLGDFLAFISSRTIPFVTFFGIFVLIFNICYIVRVSRYLFLKQNNQNSTKDVPANKKKNKKKTKKKKRKNTKK